MNPFERTDRCVDRLYAEYKKHPRLIVAVGFDDTVFNYHNYPDTGYSRIKFIMSECKRLDFFIVCFTASPTSRYGFIRDYFKSEMDIEINGINENVIDTPFGKNGKIFFNLLLDDRAGLYQALEILENLIVKINRKTMWKDSERL